jgi:hypothetical protein
MRLKPSPKGTPPQLDLWMSVVETVKTDPKNEGLPYGEILKISQKLYKKVKAIALKQADERDKAEAKRLKERRARIKADPSLIEKVRLE